MGSRERRVGAQPRRLARLVVGSSAALTPSIPTSKMATIDASTTVNTSTTLASGREALLGDRQIDVGVDGLGSSDTPKKGKASVASVAFVLLNTALGSGILGLPGAFSKAGMIGGIVLLVVTSVLAVIGVHLLCEVADRVGRPASFYSCATAAAGSVAGVVIDILIAINAFGSACSYLIVVGDVLPEVSDSFHNAPPYIVHSTGRTFWMLIALAIGAPLAYLRDLSALAITAYVAFVCVVYISIVVALFWLAPTTFPPCGPDANTTTTTTFYTVDDESCQGGVENIGPILNALDSLPIFIFAFTTNQNAISITNELTRPTPRRVLLSTCIAMLLALLLYLLVGIGGYSTYGDLVKSDILKSYPEHATIALIARVAIAFVVTTCYPMQMHPGRNSLMSLFVKFVPRPIIRRLGGPEGFPLLVLSTSILVAGSIGVALVVSSLGVMLTVIGAVCSTSVSFIVPGGCYMLLFKEKGWSASVIIAIHADTRKCHHAVMPCTHLPTKAEEC